ncbi:hypothetical protein FPOA_05385 [Fusarium poae]|uniref:Uncharacterized protein n=1 Tax=Fusarium poae TaxID=36050 RepID=A0A1B8AWF2_FUSPO|nr:hypothetical protein FPOA_05385 [Fusarium poae]
MIYMESESHYESWSALPLFDRVASPDHAKDFVSVPVPVPVPDLNDYESPTFDIDLLSEYYDFDNFPTYSLPTVDSTKTFFPEEPPFCFDVDLVNPAVEHYITTSSASHDQANVRSPAANRPQYSKADVTFGGITVSISNASSVATQSVLSQHKTYRKWARKASRLERTVLAMSPNTNQQYGALGTTSKDNSV